MKIISKISIEWYLFFFVSLIVFWQHLSNPVFSLVDDGYSLTLGKIIISDVSISNWKEHLLESDIGRFRPLYLLYFSLIYVLFGTQPIGLWLGQTIVFWLILVFLYKIVFKIVKNKYFAFLSTFIWMLFPTVSENIFRAGTAEPRQLLFILIAIHLILNLEKLSFKNMAGIAFATLLSIGTKETSILLLPFLLFLIVSKKYKKLNSLFLFFSILMGLPFVLVSSFYVVKYFLPTGYAVENFSINTIELVRTSINVFRSYQHYLLFLAILIFSFVFRMILAIIHNDLSKKIQHSTNSLSFLILIVESLFFIVAWKFQFERYFFLTWTFLLLFFGTEVRMWINLVEEFKKSSYSFTKSQLFFLICFLFSFVTISYSVLVQKSMMKILFTPFESITVYRMSYDATQISNSLISRLIADSSIEEVYLTNDGYEIMYEVGLYASQFKNRKVVVFAPNKDLPIDQNSDLYRYVDNPVKAFYQSKNSNKILIGIQKDKMTYPELNDLDDVININPNVKYNVVSTSSHWWIYKENRND